MNIGQFAQEDLSPADNLSYMLYGISKDGKYFVVIRGQISFPGLPKEGGPVRGQKLKTLQAQAATRLNGAKPEAFKPNLSQFDAICKSLRLP